MSTYVPCELCTTMVADEELVPNLQNLCGRGEIILVNNANTSFRFVG